MAYLLGTLTVDDPEAGSVTVEGDGFAAAGELVTLLVGPDVYRFLGLTTDEVAKASALASGYRATLQQLMTGQAWTPPNSLLAAQPARERLAADTLQLLGATRAERLTRLSRRIRGADALLDDDVANALQLTGAQQRKLAAAAVEHEADHQRVLAELRGVRLRGAAELQDRGTRANEAGHQRLLDRLTPEQRRQFEDMLRPAP